MEENKKEENDNDEHYGVGVIIKKWEGGIEKYWVQDRKKFPFGWACVAGHVEIFKETYREAAVRKTREEIGLEIKELVPLVGEKRFIPWNECSRGKKGHWWWLVEAVLWEGTPKINTDEVKEGGWKTQEEIIKLAREGKLEKVWFYWFRDEKLKVIPRNLKE